MKIKLHTWNEMAAIRKKISDEGRRLVFTNGCFDILHKGHVQYLSAARELGDALVVGLNSDDSVRRLKGMDRPINRDIDRAIVLSALESVDHVVIFAEDTPYRLIQTLEPDILVKGGDWKTQDIVGSDLVLAAGGKVISLDYYQGYSTTGIIEILQRNEE
jgi:D-beta-D-heptose 7-phosphate kinase/D-beta-D-heptose 1-phosphate adenosyltransferase